MNSKTNSIGIAFQAPKKSETNLGRWTAPLFMEQAEQETEHVLLEASPNVLREASSKPPVTSQSAACQDRFIVTQEQSKEFEERASSSCSVKRLPAS